MATNSRVGSTSRTFPNNAVPYGQVNSSDPQRPSFASGTPQQTVVSAFQEGGAQKFFEPNSEGGLDYYFVTASQNNNATYLVQCYDGRTHSVSHWYPIRVRPFRRVVL